MKLTKYVCFLLIVCTKVATAQYTSGFEGTVVDPSGASLVSAHVTAIDELTGVTRDTNTNSNGYFRIPELAPGRYRVEVEMTGFQKWVETEIQLDANQLRTVYPRLALGQ